jgi:hypothetical protein
MLRNTAHTAPLGVTVMLALASASAAGMAASAPQVQYYPDYNNALNVQVAGGVSKGGTVAFIGKVDSASECEQLCLKHPKRCWSFVWMRAAAPGTKSSSWELFPNSNNVFGRLPSAKTRKEGTLHYLGSFQTLAECQRAANSSSLGPFMSYTYHHKLAPVGDFATHCYGDTSTTWIAPQHREPLVDSGVAPGFPLGGGDGPLAAQCFAVTSPGFNPSYDVGAVTGVVEWSCRTDEDW